MYIWSKLLSSSLDAFSNLSKTTCPNKLFTYDCITLYVSRFPFRWRGWWKGLVCVRPVPRMATRPFTFQVATQCSADPFFDMGPDPDLT